MYIEKIILREIVIPFKTRFKHSLATRKETQAILVEIVSNRGISGFGEGTPRSYVTGETTQSVFSRLEVAAHSFLGLELESGNDVWKWLKSLENICFQFVSNTPSARCALELALIDLWGKSLGKPLSPNQKYSPLPKYSGIVSGDKPSTVRVLLEQMKKLRLQQVKLKVGDNFNFDLENLMLTRRVMGPEVELRVDANGAWSIDEAVERIEHFGRQGIKIFEQPLSAENRSDYPRLMGIIPEGTTILIDESLCSVQDASWFIINRGANGFNLKLSKNGGFLNTLRIYYLARSKGIACQLGCHVGETSILTAAGWIFSRMAENLTAIEGAFGSHLLTKDVIRQPLQFGIEGCPSFDLSESNGLGIKVEIDLVERYVVKKIVVNE
jgi:L-alanine-DL-glutamate epimerase-like enolase superfamily enzyme